MPEWLRFWLGQTDTRCSLNVTPYASCLLGLLFWLRLILIINEMIHSNNNYTKTVNASRSRQQYPPYHGKNRSQNEHTSLRDEGSWKTRKFDYLSNEPHQKQSIEKQGDLYARKFTQTYQREDQQKQKFDRKSEMRNYNKYNKQNDNYHDSVYQQSNIHRKRASNSEGLVLPRYSSSLEPSYNIADARANKDSTQEMEKTIKQIIENQIKLQKQIRMLKIDTLVARRNDNETKAANQANLAQPQDQGKKDFELNKGTSNLGPSQFKAKSVLRFLKQKEQEENANRVVFIGPVQKGGNQHLHSCSDNQYQKLSLKPLNQRLIVTDDHKQKYWQLFSSFFSKHIQEGAEEGCSIHHNKKYELDYLVNTIELQRKLKKNAVAKVYGQCNPNVYK